MNRLTAYDWPGNVRELQNAVERAVILSPGGPLHFDFPELTPSGTFVAVNPASPKRALLTREELKRQERDNIVSALKQARGKVFGPIGAAELLGTKPTTLTSRIRALQISRKDWDVLDL
jgi:transcriptional regulator with GAF, ATPase, and Fis domain